ncbi:MAG: hypothetical protein BWY76_01556 [bacterium ADurb.Bin429]|nr:MAG: hypothetical protein BWY76_01556 [bacterium ADurb.Bin429]
MKERIPVMYDRELKPEWIDYALQQSLQLRDEVALTQTLREYLREQIASPTSLRKVISQLQQAVGFRSPLSRKQLQAYYDEMSSVAPDQRISVRFRLLVESTPFVAEVVQAIRKLHVVGEKEVSASQLYDRLIAKYGDRGTIPRRVRYVLRTLVNLGVMEHREKKWLIADDHITQ